VVILQDSGMRPDEVFPMRIENIYWDQNRIWVPEGKTDNATRFVPMSDRMKTMLRAWCGSRKEGWIFPSSRSKSGHLKTIAQGFQAARGRAGLDKKLVPHSARHTYGTYTMEKSGNAFAVSKSMGHADPITSERRRSRRCKRCCHLETRCDLKRQRSCWQRLNSRGIRRRSGISGGDMSNSLYADRCPNPSPMSGSSVELDTET
jgi:integrase